jgi:hypothetical protein
MNKISKNICAKRQSILAAKSHVVVHFLNR